MFNYNKTIAEVASVVIQKALLQVFQVFAFLFIYSLYSFAIWIEENFKRKETFSKSVCKLWLWNAQEEENGKSQMSIKFSIWRLHQFSLFSTWDGNLRNLCDTNFIELRRKLNLPHSAISQLKKTAFYVCGESLGIGKALKWLERILLHKRK